MSKLNPAISHPLLYGCWCTWYSKEEHGRQHQESEEESYCDRDPKDLRSGIYANARESACSVLTDFFTQVNDATAA